jgi:hypothetical protein
MGKSQRQSISSPQTVCPVLPLALCVGELWDAHATAQERESDGKKKGEPVEEVSNQIDDLRIVLEDVTSFKRARSLAGALFQVALALDISKAIHQEIPSVNPAEDRLNEKDYQKQIRLLESVALALRDALGLDYESVREVVSTYLNIDEGNEDRALRWIEEIPARPAS